MDRILNHVEDSTTNIYDRYAYAKEDRRIMEAVAARFMALIGGGGASNVVVAFGHAG